MRSKTYDDYEYYIGTWTRYTVWVGGLEVNGRYLNKKEANELASEWRSNGYEDVKIEKMVMKATKSRKKK